MQVVEQNVWNDPILSYNDSSYYIKVHNILKSRRLYIMNYSLRCILGPGKEHKCLDWLCVQSECIAGRRGRRAHAVSTVASCCHVSFCHVHPHPSPGPGLRSNNTFSFSPKMASWPLGKDSLSGPCHHHFVIVTKTEFKLFF